MKKILLSHKALITCLLLVVSAKANQRAQGDCMKGGNVVVTSGVSSTTKVMQSFPACTVTVYQQGTLTLATIFSDNLGTSLSNPFTANSSGHWFFYAANARYDVQLSGGGLASPFTLGDILLADPLAGTPAVTSVSAGTGISVTGPTTTPTVANTWGAAPSSGTQTQQLQIQPNTGNNTTYQWSSKPVLIPADYNFPTQSPTSPSAISIGSNAITVTPCPLGVAGTDTFHYLYIAGTGTAEAALITGGSCTSGASTGTVIVTAANTHSAGYTVSSYAGGLPEAIQIVKANSGGTIRLPVGTLTTNWTVYIPAGIPIEIGGSGPGVSTVQLGNSVNADVFAVENFASLTGSNTAPAGIFRSNLHDFTIDGNKANESGTSWCLRVYGHAYQLSNLGAQNCLSGGIYSEYAVNPTLNTPSTDLETYWRNIRVKLSNGVGIQFRGPHDSYLTDIVSDEHNSQCFMAQGNAVYNGNVHLSHFDGYNCSLSNTVPACEVDSVALVGAAVTCSGSVAGSHGLYLNGAQSVNLTGANLGALGAGANGLNIGTVTGSSLNYIQGIITSSSTSAGSYALSIGLAQNNTIDGVFSCPATGPACINISANDQGAEVIRGTTGSAQQLVTGTIPLTDNIQLQALGTVQVGPQAITQIPQESTWHHYHVAVTSGNWVVNGVTGAALAGALTQSVTLDNLPLGAAPDRIRIVTAVAFTGTTTANVTGIGNGGSITLYYGGTYNLQTAVSTTNLTDVAVSAGANTTSTQVLQFQITTTGANVSSIANGAAVDFWVKWGTLQ